MTKARKMLGGIVRLMLIVGALYAALSGIPDAFESYIGEVEVQRAESPEQVRLLFKGSNLYRPNSIYLNGKRIKGVSVERLAYDQCFVELDRSEFQAGQWYRMELGFHKWGIINLLSSPLWMEWTD